MKPVMTMTALWLAACSSTQQNFSDVVSIAATEEKPLVAGEPVNDLIAYKFDNQDAQAELVGCAVNGSQGAWALVNRDHAGFNHKNFCSGWIAQAFMRAGYSVIGVNRPGYGRSTGMIDFAGAASRASLEVVVSAAGAKHPAFKAIVGLWGYGSGATAALFYAKGHPELGSLLLGGGIYDLEAVHKGTEDADLKAAVDIIVKSEGEKAYEERSIAWDFHGLPKRLAMYHGDSDNVTPVGQAKSFRDSLAAQEYAVSLNILASASHDIPWLQHQEIIGKLLKELAAGRAEKGAETRRE